LQFLVLHDRVSASGWAVSHLVRPVHADDPQAYRDAVEQFLAELG